jgi:hypothetical protein
MKIFRIAEETGLSSKTVRRRIDRMIKDKLIEHEIDWYLGIEDDIWFLLYVRSVNPIVKDELFKKLTRFEGNIFSGGDYYVNEPALFAVDGFAPSMNDLREIVNTTLLTEGVTEVFPTVVLMSHMFDTWVNRISRGELPLPESITVKLSRSTMGR